MDDLISRQAAIDAIRDMQAFEDDNGQPYLYLCDVMAVFTDEEELPPIQPKMGKWIKISPANIYECSECGKSVMTNDICTYDFCHGCGADMREVNNESN